MADASKTEQATAPASAVAEGKISEFEALITKEFKPRTDKATEAVHAAVRTLAEQALHATTLIPGDAVNAIQGMIAELDRRLTEQVNLIIHHEEFKKLEGTWRGLHHLVFNTETDEFLKIRVFNISKDELRKTLERFPGAVWDQSPIFKKAYENEFGTPARALWLYRR